MFKIPLANILGGVGMSYFVSAYDIFTPLYSMTITGLSVATSRMVSEAGAAEKGSVLAASRRIFLTIGLTASGLLLFLAHPLATAIGNPGAAPAVRLIAPALLFSCVAASYRGYFQGRQNMLPTAKSQVIEALVKFAAGSALAYFLLRTLPLGVLPMWLTSQWGSAGEQSALKASASGAVLGVTLSSLAGMMYMASYYHRNIGSTKCVYSRNIAKKLIDIALPIAMTSAAANLTTIIDVASVMNCLKKATESGLQTMLSLYSGCIPSEVTSEMIPEFLYGSYSGLAISLFNLVPALTAGIGVSAIPAIAQRYSRGDHREVNSSIKTILTTTSIIAFPAGLGIFTFSKEILTLLYPRKLMEVCIIAPVLRIMGISTILVAFSGVFNSILQGAGRERAPLIGMMIGGGLKMTTNFILVSRPEVNIHGVAYGTLICYGFLVIYAAVKLSDIGVGRLLPAAAGRPAAAAILCCVAAKTIFLLCCAHMNESIALLICFAIAGIIYLCALILTKCVKFADICVIFSGANQRK